MEDAFRDMERHNRIPRGFLLLFFGLIAWGVCYIAAYTPAFSGWSQYETLRREIETGRKPAAAASALAENPYKRDAKSIAEGKAIYRDRCAECHGEALTGDVGPGLTGALKHGETDGAKYESIAKGRPDGMPGFEAQLGPERIWKVVAYIDSAREPGKKP